MPRLQYAQLRYLAIILLAWLAVFFLTRSALLPLSMAWGATTSPAPLQGVRQANCAQPLDARINLYRMAPDLYRTGLIAALYRVIYQGWSKEQALAEMAGCSSGRSATGPLGQFDKDVPRYMAEPLYTQGWDDGFRQCEDVQRIDDRQARREEQWRDDEWRHHVDQAMAKALRR
ncbi:hypothetical protein N5E99_08785 [Pseudomonas chengduensis]|jgi:hypothetical protein|uniref:Uncharacterized protein n=1 Tax=Ectopseudomonas chengduensis TaxID=489632 RepID=A0A1G6LX94_9GAMM|nr:MULTISPECIES: hypothetical protein [Pseudomonas]ERH50750.1 hypothetical protein O203_12740 [Pseudomonas chengduensis]MBP3060572.1 hypothetical protein [Pseudomonas chengduensis]MDH0959989.1 hypothetical protein [Pseudomonas chengduensis]MDH1535844.1 hypothetical protein [Pseudomonas chengduensis]MDH1619781.1 hypothetical protein [Pseudomonas chengduensis]